ncbi:hypothetical protein [Neoroseomonas soli]|uniref:Uncharacterized protein n=1 Tax=Neoroseomonas soli TaxID=1081025 RepID=A0A9X9WT85_9PROT|nr:hypothetical protein [Neoroseomonas soli]MBR0670364.1 hypothetical protein [Neoroseomonas soli]
MRPALGALAVAAIATLLLAGAWGTMFGAMAAAAEVRTAPPVLAAVALMLLARGPSGLPAAGGWAVLGAAVAVAWRVALGTAGENGWIPGEEPSDWEVAAEGAWLIVLAVLSWRGLLVRWAGPLVAAVVATTRIGAYGQALVPVLWEDTLREAVLVSTSICAGFVAGVMVVVLAGWAISILARIPERWVAPGRVLAGLAILAALARVPPL